MTTTRLLLALCGTSLLAQEPYAFLPNHGQWPAQVRAAVRHGAMTTWLTDTGWTTRAAWLDREPDPRGEDGSRPLPMAHAAVVEIELVGGSSALDTLGAPLPGTVGFWLGNDPRRHATAVPRQDGAVRVGAWPGIDLQWTTRGTGLAYDLRVAAGTSLTGARFRARGQQRLTLDVGGALVFDVGFGELRHEPPRAWQMQADGSREELPVRFVLGDDATFGFVVEGRDEQSACVVDPLVTWVARIGGSSSDWPGLRQAMDRDPATGRIAVCGQTLSFNFPVTNGSSLVALQDGCLHVREAAGTLNFSAYLGGSGNDSVHAVRWHAGQLVFCGVTTSSNHPVTNTPMTLGCLQTTHGGGNDMIIGRFDPVPSPPPSFLLGYCTYFGYGGNEGALAVAPLAGGEIAIAAPSNGSPLPVSPAAFQPTVNGLDEGYLAIIDPNQNGTAQWRRATWFGGNGTDVPQMLLRDASGNFVVGGWTASTASLPLTSNAMQSMYQGGSADGFVAIVSSDFTSLLYGTYLGGPGADEADDIAFDSQGRLAIGSWAGGLGFSFPLPGGPFPTPAGGANDGYALLLDRSLPPLQQVVWGTYLGGSWMDGVNGIAVDSADRIVVVGPAQGSNGFTNFPSTSWTLPFVGGPTGPLGGQWDAYVARFDSRQSGAAQLTFATFLGGSGHEYNYDVVLDERGRAVVTGPTTSHPFLGTGTFGNQDIFVSSIDMLATVAERGGAPTPACANVVLDAYHVQLPIGFDLTLTASNAPPAGFGLLLVGAPDMVGTPLPPFGFTAHLDLLQPIASVTFLLPDALGFASFSLTTTATAPTGIGVQMLWFGGCAPFVASDMLRL